LQTPPIGRDYAPPLDPDYVRVIHGDEFLDVHFDLIEEFLDKNPASEIVCFSPEHWNCIAAQIDAAWAKRKVFTVADSKFLEGLHISWCECVARGELV
jgi:hypothetical protein